MTPSPRLCKTQAKHSHLSARWEPPLSSTCSSFVWSIRRWTVDKSEPSACSASILARTDCELTLSRFPVGLVRKRLRRSAHEIFLDLAKPQAPGIILPALIDRAEQGIAMP